MLLQDYVWEEFKTQIVEQIVNKAHSIAIADKKKVEKVKMDRSSEDFTERIRELMRDLQETIYELDHPCSRATVSDSPIATLMKRGIRRAIASLDISSLFTPKKSTEKKETE